MQLPRLTTPQGAYDWLIALLLLTAVFFGLIFLSTYLGVF